MSKSILLLAGVLAVAALGGAMDSETSLHACAKEKNGQLRLVDGPDDCKKSEYHVSWAQQGPAGAAGPAGAPGPAGPPGADGASSGFDANSIYFVEDVYQAECDPDDLAIAIHSQVYGNAPLTTVEERLWSDYTTPEAPPWRGEVTYSIDHFYEHGSGGSFAVAVVTCLDLDGDGDGLPDPEPEPEPEPEPCPFGFTCEPDPPSGGSGSSGGSGGSGGSGSGSGGGTGGSDGFGGGTTDCDPEVQDASGYCP